MRKLLLLGAFLLSTVSFAEPRSPIIWGPGNAATILPGSLRIGTGGSVAVVGQEDGLSVLYTVSPGTSSIKNAISAINHINGNAPNIGIHQGIRIGLNRTITTSQTDTARVESIGIGQPIFNVPSGQTLTNTSTLGFANITVSNNPSIVGGGSIDFARWVGIIVNTNATAVGTRDIGILIGPQSGGTNNAQISDNSTFTGNWTFHFSTANPTYHAGNFRIGSETPVSGAFTEILTVNNPATANPSVAIIGNSTLTPISGNFAMTQNAIGIRSQYTRTITTSQTDTGLVDVIAAQAPAFTISAGQTLGNSSTTGISGVRIAAPTLSGGGSLDILRYISLQIATSSLATGTRKIGILVGPHTGASNNATISDNATFTGTYFLNSTSTADSLISGQFQINTAGKGFSIKEGSNAKMGTCTLVAGSCTVSNTSVTANSRILITSNADSGTPGWLRVSAKTASTSFVITSSSGTDTSTVVWEILEAL
jgi:hypothetical protein